MFLKNKITPFHFYKKNFVWVLHRIGTPPYERSNPNNGLYISAEKFKELVRFFKSIGYTFVSMDNFLEATQKTKLITITLDDGYTDNLKYGLPIFEELNVPVLTFVNTHYVMTDTHLWWLKLGNEIFEKNLEIDKTDEKLKLFFLKRRDLINRHISKWTEDVDLKNVTTKTNEIMSPNELLEFSRSPLVTLGAHTHKHISLRIHTDREIYDDLTKNIHEINSMTNKSVKYFAYPYGSSAEVKDCTNIFEDLKIAAAFTTKSEFYNYDCSKFMIPRISIDDKTTPQAILRHFVKLKICKFIGK